MIDRRDFLVGAAGVGLAGCARRESQSPPAVVPAATIGADEFLRRMNDGRSAIANDTPLSDVLIHYGADPKALPPDELARHETLFRKSLDSLLLSASFRDLSPAEQADPRVQSLMLSSLDSMDDAVVGLANHLEKIPDLERRAIGKKLRAEPDLPLNLFEALDRKAKITGIDPKRRMQLRSIATQAGWRLSAQPVSLFVDEHVAKVRTIAERQNKELLTKIATAPTPGAEPASKPGETVLKVGAFLLGISLIVAFAGGLIAAPSGNVVGLVMITAGVLGAIGGLITLLVGLIIRLVA
jgi:hypothetical protein